MQLWSVIVMLRTPPLANNGGVCANSREFARSSPKMVSQWVVFDWFQIFGERLFAANDCSPRISLLEVRVGVRVGASVRVRVWVVTVYHNSNPNPKTQTLTLTIVRGERSFAEHLKPVKNDSTYTLFWRTVRQFAANSASVQQSFASVH